MHLQKNIKPVKDFFGAKRIHLPEQPGIYAFWWIANKSVLMAANRRIVLKGPGQKPVEVEYRDWWPEELVYPCLYIGKTTNIKRRFSLHIKNKCIGRLHCIYPLNHKAKPCTTSCQLRFGIEHIFPSEMDPLKILHDSVGFSYRTDFSDNAIAERFFEEDRLVGIWRPWFNIDSER